MAASLIKDGYSHIFMLAVMTAGHLTGSLLSYGLGWWGEGWLSRHMQKRPRFIQASQAIHKWYEKHGKATIFATRFIGYVRPWSSMVAGFAHIDFKSFVLYTLAGSILFNIAVMTFTHYLLSWWDQFGYWFKIGSASVCVLSFIAIFFVFHVFNKRLQEVPVQE